MNDFTLTEEMLKKATDNSALMWSIIIFVGLNFFASIGGIIFQLYIKKLDKKNYRIQLRETKRLQVYEELSFTLEALTYYDGRVDNSIFYKKIIELAKYMRKYKIYINKNTNKILMQFIEYFEGVYFNYDKKNYEVEKDLFEKFIIEFNK